jgi:hypothetical protein
MSKKSVNTKPQFHKIHILCEDKVSSFEYFRKLVILYRDELKNRQLTITVDGKGFDPSKLKKEAQKLIKEYDEIWLVFDKDKHDYFFDVWYNTNQNNIKCYVIIPCFEYWVLLHFEYTTKPFLNCDEISTYLKKYISDYNKEKKYYKDKLCDILLKDTIKAITNADAVLQENNIIEKNTNPYINIHVMIKEIIGLT